MHGVEVKSCVRFVGCCVGWLGCWLVWGNRFEAFRKVSMHTILNWIWNNTKIVLYQSLDQTIFICKWQFNYLYLLITRKCVHEILYNMFNFQFDWRYVAMILILSLDVLHFFNWMETGLSEFGKPQTALEQSIIAIFPSFLIYNNIIVVGFSTG